MKCLHKSDPAFLYGTTLLIGTSSTLFWPLPFTFLWPFLWALYLLFYRLYPVLLLLVFACIYPAFFPIQDYNTHQSDLVQEHILQQKEHRSVAKVRFQLKEQFAHFLSSKLSERTTNFFSALIAGTSASTALRFYFKRLGLQHILAISGFHFAILVSFLSSFLSLFLNEKPKYLLLLVAIQCYFFFVGPMPAVQRSWLAATIYFLGKWMRRPTRGLNLLGCALIVEMILNPAVSKRLGFQLSYLSTASILLFVPKITIQDPTDLTLFQKMIYLISLYTQKAFSITWAVNLAIFPLLLYHFHSFPLLSLIYNLFFPFLVSLALFLLLFTLILHVFLPWVSGYFFSLTDWLTSEMLDLVENIPKSLDYSICYSNCPAWIIPIYLFSLFTVKAYQKRLS